METASLSLGVLVPGDSAGKLIGKQGSGLKQVRDMSQCRVQLSQEPDSQNNRRCDINGPTVEHMASAVHAIGTRLFEQTAQHERVTLMIAFPNEYVGRVIGRGGQNLRSITEQTGVEVKLGKDAVTDQGDRVGQLLGIPNQLGAAVRIALSAVSAPQVQAAPAPMGHDYQQYNQYRGQPAQSTQSMNNWRQPAVVGMAQSAPRMGQMPAMGAALTQVRSASGIFGEMQVHIIVPGKFIGAILGKEGSQIKQLLTDTGCTHLAVSKKEPGEQDRRVIAVGGFDECAKAQQAVWQIFSENAQQAGAEVSFNCIMMVPTEKAGAVIGKQGANFKQIREKFGINVKLPKDEVQGFRPCTLGGALETVLEVERQILDLIWDGDGGPPPGNGAKRPLEAEGLVPASAAYAPYAADPEAKRHKGPPPGEEPYTKLLVPSNTAGAIIGKQGSTLKQIREGTGARVEVLPAAQTPEFHDSRVVILKGDFDSRQAAVVKVLSAAFEASQSDAVLKMMVPKRFVGALIGKQASNLKAIRESSGINVKVEKQELNGERPVESQGSLDQILNAATLVMGSCEATPTAPLAMGIE